MIHDLKRQGLAISEIARRTGLDRKTVRRRLAEGPGAPTYGPRKARPRAAFRQDIQFPVLHSLPGSVSW